MYKMNINPKKIQSVILSHFHGDHTGGLSGILKFNTDMSIYVPASFPERFKEAVRTYGYNLVEVKEPVKVCETAGTTGELDRGTKEQSCVINTQKGGVVITGCAHPGILKLVKRAKDLIDNKIPINEAFDIIKQKKLINHIN